MGFTGLRRKHRERTRWGEGAQAKSSDPAQELGAESQEFENLSEISGPVDTTNTKYLPFTLITYCERGGRSSALDSETRMLDLPPGPLPHKSILVSPLKHLYMCLTHCIVKL